MKLKDLNQETQILALDILDFLVTEGKMPVHTQVAAKDFLTILISLLKTRDAPEVQVKILYLIKKWGTRFEKQKDILPNFFEVFNTLKSNSVVFPENFESSYQRYLGGENNQQNNQRNYEDDNYGNQQVSNNNSNNNYNDNQAQFQQTSFNYSNGVNLNLNPESYEKKYKKFVSELTVLLDNITLANVNIFN